MKKIKSIGVIGGDLRQLYCARSLLDDGYDVCISGFDRCSDHMGLENTGIRNAVENSDALMLPLPVSKDGAAIYSPFSDSDAQAAAVFEMIRADQPVFCGLEGALPESFFSGKRCFFYGRREDFAAANAVPTAEGALSIAVSNSPVTINSSECLVAGFGRIGRVLSVYLRGMGADVTVSTRKSHDLELIRAWGMKAVSTNAISGSYDFVFNTIPEMIFDRKLLSRCCRRALVIDLASAPGGADKKAAEQLGIPLIHALSLPGKTAPETAGRIIKNSIYRIMEEEWK